MQRDFGSSTKDPIDPESSSALREIRCETLKHMRLATNSVPDPCR